MNSTKNLLKYSIVFGLFLFPFIAFLVPNAMFFPYIVGKGFTFRILVEILFGLFVLLAFIEPEYRPKFSWITKSVLFFTLAILVSDLLGANVYKSLWSNYERMEGFVLIGHLLLYYIVASSIFKTKAEWNKLFNTSIIASVIMSIYSFFQLAGKITISQGGVRVDATFGNASYLAIYLVFHIFLCLYILAGEGSQKWQKWIYGGVIFLETEILYFTATRGAILGLIGGLVFTGVLIAWKERENKIIRKWASSLLIGILVFVLGFIALKNTSVVQKSPVLSRFSTLGLSEFQGQGRYFIWPMAVKGFIERPVFGWGQENFNFVFNKYYDPRMFGQEEWFDRTHDVVLDWLIAGGLVGLLSYISMFVAMFYYIWRKNSLLKLSEKSIFTGMIFAYVFHNIFVFDNLISYIIFFSLLSYVHSVSTEKDGVGKFYTKTFSKDALNYIVAPVVVILTVAIVYFVNVPAINANFTLITSITPQKEGIQKNLELFKKVYSYNSFGSGEATEQLVTATIQISASDQVSSEIKKGFYDYAKMQIEKKITSSPHDARYLVFAGSFLNRSGQYDQAEKYLIRAIAESPKKQSIYFELGTSYLGKGNPSKTFETFKKAYDLNPDVKESKIIYTLGAIYTKNNSILNEMQKVLDQETIVSDNRFLKAYADIGDYNAVTAILNARLAKDPKNMQNRLSLASAYNALKQKQKAIDIIKAMIVDDPSFKTQGDGYIEQIKSGK